ncbi:hypothetical protein FLJC2902T_22770 [Flavobacterium limnosediminis JC2902]|uniref:Helix-turn-helix domain-containing protein n=1 Tax=Flavobacterium limnosediminis JC2902 TaxID=1341181 RepID=V6SLF8_9FLAO|nr:helix-turn-helix domain-containing protein [Flavobacterium limnosediminis]ESU27097.1 hypothetical protein FLJC2902T_22770 [Flavobacterium limnosediminis JC2902]
MSSNLNIKKRCEHCKNEFVAKTTKTRYCSLKCNSRHYKILHQQKSIKTIEKATELKLPPLEEINKKDFLTVKETAFILNMSVRTVYRLVAEKEINSYNFSIRKILIRRKDIDSYFDINLNGTNIDRDHLKKLITLENSYTINEVLKKYNISNGALYRILSRLEIPKKNFGKHVLVRKEDIDKIFVND